MKLSIRTALRSLSLLVLTVGFMPGCDNDEALGLSAEEIDLMSEEELDELAELEADADDLGHSVDSKHMAMPIHPGHPGPSDGPHDLVTTASSGTSTGFNTFDTIWHPIHTHESTAPKAASDTIWHPVHTHESTAPKAASDTIWHPTHTHAQVPAATDDRGTPVHPTHDEPLAFKLDVFDPGCQPKTDELPVFANRS